MIKRNTEKNSKQIGKDNDPSLNGVFSMNQNTLKYMEYDQNSAIVYELENCSIDK